MDNQNEGFVTGSIAIVMQMSRWSGMAPLKFFKQTHGWRVSVSNAFNIYGHLLATFLIAVISVTVVIDITIEQSQSVRGRTNMLRVVWFLDVFSMLLTLSSASYWGNTRMQSCKDIMERIYKISRELRLNSFKWHHAGEKFRVSFFIIWAIFPLFVAGADYYLLVNAMFESQGTTKTKHISITYGLYYLMYYLHNLIEMQFVALAMCIVSNFRALNEHLNIMLKDLNAMERSFSIKCINTVQVFTKNRITVASKDDKPKYPRITVRQLCVAYASLCDIQREVNDCYGSVMLLQMITIILHLIVAPYYLLFDLFAGASQSDSLSNAVLQAWWSLYHIGTLVMMIEPGHYTHLEIKKTKGLISLLMRCHDASNEQLSVDLEMFYRQLMLNEVVYSPLGITDLTRPLVAGITGIIITYLVILLQLQQTPM